MNRDVTAEHRETRSDLPEPLGATAAFDPCALGLPVSALSLVSLAVLVLTFAVLQRGAALRALFELPVPPQVPAALALVLTTWVLVGGSSRPGRLFPRLWAAGLALISGSLAVAAAVEPAGRSWHHALAFAALCASLVLTPRLVGLRPYDPMVRLLAPLALVLAGIFVLSAWSLGETAIRRHEGAIEAEIARIHHWTGEVSSIVDSDWSRLDGEHHRAASRVGRFRTLSLEPPSSTDPALWRAASALRRDEELIAAWRDLIDAAAVGLDPARGPSLSRLSEPPVRYDPRRGGLWVHPKLRPLSEIVDHYHWNLGRLFRELRPESPAGSSRPAWATLAEHYRKRETEVADQLAELAESWADHWVASALPEGAYGIESSAPSPSELLRHALRIEPSLALASPWQLLGLDLEGASQLAKAGAGCYLRRKTTGTYHLDCVTYDPQPRGLGATLRLGIHLSYPPSAKPGSDVYPDASSLLLFRPDRDAALPKRWISELYAEAENLGYFPERDGETLAGGFSGRAGPRRFTLRAPELNATSHDKVLQVRVRWN